MTRGTKMLLMARDGGDNRRTERDGYSNPRNEYGGARMDYGGTRMEYPRMNHDYTGMNYGRSNYPEQEWETTNSNYGDTEARFRDRRGREHYDNGRFAPRNAMEKEGARSRQFRSDDAGRSEYPPFVPPVYRGTAMNRIGFAAEPNREMESNYPMNANYPRMEETGYRTSEMSMGRAKGGEMMLTEEMAHEWMEGLHNEDGTKGPHWTMDQVKQVMSQRGIKGDVMEYWVILNSLYSDYCGVLKKHGANNMDVYTDLAKAWIDDKDAMEGKAARYFQYIVK